MKDKDKIQESESCNIGMVIIWWVVKVRVIVRDRDQVWVKIIRHKCVSHLKLS